MWKRKKTELKDNKMGSFRENILYYDNKEVLEEDELIYTDDVSDVFDQYLSKKMEENDLISYWLIRDLYQHYLTAIKKSKMEIV